MSVSHRVTGTWAELTADGTVTIPATPQAGDRMYLFARWKDFSVTATVVNWTELAEFSDGSVSAGNGAGSVKVACWYRDWQSGDTAPTIDFSASPDNASAVIMVMAKGAADTWLTPVAVTAAMTNWTTSSQIVSASSTASVLGGGVVIGLIGIRDDSAVMTRPTSGIDDSAAAITWNGDYVASPATHHSTTTGFDGAADLGYRLVTVGAAGVTLRMTGTISAAETGAALWVVQGVATLLTPTTATLNVGQFAPSLVLAVTPLSASLSSTAFAPQLRLALTPAAIGLTVTQFAPLISSGVVPATAALAIASFALSLRLTVTPTSVSLVLSANAPVLQFGITPPSTNLSLTIFTPDASFTENTFITPETASLALTTLAAAVGPPRIIYLDPGGDAVQAAGYFNSIISAGAQISFDSTQQVVGVGSYKFDSDDGTVEPTLGVAGVLGAARRVSFYWRYDSVPDVFETVTEFVDADGVAYSGGGFTNPENLVADDAAYATASPARNAGQGTVFDTFGLAIPIGAVIDSVKIIYKRKYDTTDSIGISRVKWRVDGEEGPDHDNTAEPTTDTVVEVDVTDDRGWTWQDLTDVAFEVIAEARRGDTDTAHTQSWDYVKVAVVYHNPVVIMRALSLGGTVAFRLAVASKGDGVVLRFADGASDSFDGITKLSPNTWYRISFPYLLHAADDLDIDIFLDGLLELSVAGAATNTVSLIPNLEYGWISTPGVDHLCWFDQPYIDDGDDLRDPFDPRSTAKLPASVNEDNWNATGGTGAVSERPLSETNFKQHTASTGVRQTYTLEADDAGDVDISAESLLGYMGWAWAKKGSGDDGDAPALILNNITVHKILSTTPALLKHLLTTGIYPDDDAGIGMRSNEESADTFLYECGAVVAYQGPDVNPDRLLAYQLLAQDSVTELTDDLRADPPDTYTLKWQVAESSAQVTIEVYAITAEDQEPQLRRVEQAGPGTSLIPIDNPGIEVSFIIRVTEASVFMGLRRYLNLN